jgi:hypothetical protein
MYGKYSVKYELIMISNLLHRKSESATFPDHLFKTLPNLIHFVLQYGSATLRLHTGLSICSHACITGNIASTAKRIHALNHGVSILVKSRSVLQDKIRQDTTLSDADELSEDVMRIRQWYEDIISRRIWVKRLQLKEARHLHKILVTQGPYIEKHRLSSILKRYTAFAQRFTEFHEDDELFELDENNDFINFDMVDAINEGL